MRRGAPVRRGRFFQIAFCNITQPRTLARGENDGASSQNVTHRNRKVTKYYT
jgi:hypothetical protein